MATEEVDPRFADLDAWSLASAMEAMWEGQLAAAAAVGRALPAITLATSAANEALGDGSSGPATTRLGIDQAWRSILQACAAAAEQAGMARQRLPPPSIPRYNAHSVTAPFQRAEVGSGSIWGLRYTLSF